MQFGFVELSHLCQAQILSGADNLPNRNTGINQHPHYNCNPEPTHTNRKKQWQQYWLQTHFSDPSNYRIQTRNKKESYTTTIAGSKKADTNQTENSFIPQ
jgi:hypothetical protein